MFRPTLANPSQKRTLRPLYAQHQATPYGGFLDPDWDKSHDILPGTVMCRKEGEIFAPYDSSDGTQKPFGLSALFVAPELGIDEVSPTGTNLFTVWVGDSQAVVEVLAPAFDTEADWTLADDGSRQLLYATSEGKLTTDNGAGDPIAELVDVIDDDKIVVRMNRHA